MATHPYISGAGNITQMIGFLRKNFPAVVNSDTVKKLGIAPQNESYVINALQFIGIIDEESKRTDRGHSVLTTHDEEAFKSAFQGLVREAYKDLFDLRGNDAWTISKDELIGYFRSTDKTSDVIGTRQAGVFQAFRGLAGYEQANAPGTKNNKTSKTPTKSSNAKTTKSASKPTVVNTTTQENTNKKDMALTVRIEINLPAEASAETYDNIFKSMKANLLND
ncbi:DUF5343 domain-containing protein [Dyella sp. 2HG41-7]|uniref:DUF5343 domain-containing protein n=1 Tax=Dyella sp. 2HG41-7 TaxID=2883239 RepID=UPI001F333051|nr:DUF5343 domain-containing protein [Dyella sp. 2HG41-7]